MKTLWKIIEFSGIFSISLGLDSQAGFISTQIKQGFHREYTILHLHISNFKLHKHMEEKIFCTFEAIGIEHKSCYDNWFLCPQEMFVGLCFNHMTHCTWSHVLDGVVVFLCFCFLLPSKRFYSRLTCSLKSRLNIGDVNIFKKSCTLLVFISRYNQVG